MNNWLIAILAILIGNYILELVVSEFNLKALSPNLPKEFESVFDKEKYEKSQKYTRITTGFSLIETSSSLFITLTFLLAGGFNYIDIFVRSFGYGTIITGLLFTGLLALLSFLIGLPFSLYSTFVIEEKFGFNRTTVSTYFADIIKGFFLAVIIGTPLLALILWFFENTGSYS